MINNNLQNKQDLYGNNFENLYTKNTDKTHRKELGQFFTPFSIAFFMSEWITQNPKKNLKILDPATGLGIFERALEKLNYIQNKKLSFDLWEIDSEVTHALKTILTEYKSSKNIINGDFMDSDWKDLYDGIIANPPYYKHHYIKNKDKVFSNIVTKTKFKFSLQTNIYCWFLIKCLNILDDNGRLAFIVPSEFLNSNYGVGIKQYILQSGLIMHLINVSFETNLFDNALTTSTIILAQKDGKKSGSINFYNVIKLEELVFLSDFLQTKARKNIAVNKLDPFKKWRNYFLEDQNELEDNNLIRFSTYGKFKRGIATGSNDYFTLTAEEIKEINLPKDVLIKCISKSSYVEDLYFSNEDYNSLVKNGKKAFIFDGQKSDSDSVKKYIRVGEKKEIHQRYLNKNRTPWFAIEKRSISKIWVSVFGRGKLKLVWNDSNCTYLTCFHGFYPTLIGEKYMNIIFLYLNTPSAIKLLDKERREYGNGLKKYEPNDINKTLVVNFDLLSSEEITVLSKLQKKFLKSGTDRESILKEAEIIFSKACLSSSKEDFYRGQLILPQMRRDVIIAH